MRSLGGIVLPAQIYWANRRQHQDVAQAAAFTVAGGVRVWSQGITAGRPIDLSTADRDWLSLTEVQALEALANTPGGQYSFIWDDFSAAVMFRHHEPPAFSAEQVQRLVSENDDLWTVEFKLMVI